jgi:drug/metabolite transporter (DMT)-like permease
MLGILGAFIGATGFGTANVVIKKSLANLSIPQTLMMSTLSGVVFLTIFTFLSASFEAITPLLLLKASLLAGGEVLLYLVLYKTFEVSNVTVATAVSSTYPLLSTVVTVLVFSELLPLNKLAMIIVLVAGALVTSIDWSAVIKDGLDKKDLTKGFKWILATTLLHAIYFPLAGNFTSEGSWQTKLLMIKIMSAIFLFVVFYLIQRKKILPPKNKIPFTSLLGLLEVIGWAGFSWATNSTDGQTAILIAVLNSSALVTAILAYFFLDEKLSKIQYMGILMIVVGLTGLSL